MSEMEPLKQHADEEVFRNEHNPIDRDAYYQAKAREIESGALTWAVRTFDANQGRVYDLFNKNVRKGFIDEEAGLFDAYYLEDERAGARPVLLGTADLVQAINLLKTYVKHDNGGETQN